jgi:hypothetical protein
MPSKKGTNTKTSSSTTAETDMDTKQTHQVSLPLDNFKYFL